jgi:hypothetical protein
MGAVSVHVEGVGTSMNDAFQKILEKAREEYGSDYYSGEMNNAELAYDWTKRYNGKNIEALYDKSLETGCKNELVGICLRDPKPNKNKTKSQVHRTPQKGSRKWATKYVGTGWEGNPVCEADTLTECIKKARAHTDKTQETVTIDIIKRLVKGGHNCARVTYKKSKTEKLGLYAFMGWLSD